jgi:hypothetical protein
VSSRSKRNSVRSSSAVMRSGLLGRSSLGLLGRPELLGHVVTLSM